MKKRFIALLITCLLIVFAACKSADPVPAEPAPLPVAEIPSAEAEVSEIVEGVVEVDVSNGDDDTAVLDTQVFTASNETYAAYNAYRNLSKQLNLSVDGDASDVDSYEMNFVMEIDVTVDGLYMPSGEMAGNIKVVVDDDIIKLAMTMDMSSMGAGVMEMYFDGTEGFIIMEGMIIPLEFDDVMDQFDSAVNLPDFEDKAIKSVEIKEIGGNTQYTIIVCGKELAGFVLESMGEELGGLEMDIEIVIDDVTMVVLVDADEIPLNYSMTMKMEMEIEGYEMIMVMKMVYDVVKWGEGVVIDIPSI